MTMLARGLPPSRLAPRSRQRLRPEPRGGRGPRLNAIQRTGRRQAVLDPRSPIAARGVAQIQYRAENVHILPVFGAGALNVSPRVGHLHITVDDLPWHWADASDNNTIDIVGLPPGQHKLLIELVNAAHQVFAGQGQTVTFTVPGPAK